MTAVSAWIVDPQGRPVPGVDVLLTAQSWRGQQWAARSDARGRATFDVPPMDARSAGGLPTSGQPCDRCGCKESGQPGCQFGTCWLRKPIYDLGCSKDQTGSIAFIDPMGGGSVEKCLAEAQSYPIKCGTPTVVEKFEKGTCV